MNTSLKIAAYVIFFYLLLMLLGLVVMGPWGVVFFMMPFVKMYEFLT